VPFATLDSFSGEQWDSFCQLRLSQLLKEVADKRSKYVTIVQHQLDRKQLFEKVAFDGNRQDRIFSQTMPELDFEQ
jgi:hypothetical protein